MRVQFADFIVDNETRQVLRGGEAVPLSPKAFQLFEILLKERPRVVSKKELIERLWPDTVVSEENLKARIREIRAALRESGRRSVWIRTVQGFGYAFNGAAEERSASAGTHSPDQMYWIQYGAHGFAVSPGETYVGRDPRCGIWIDDESVSRKHARIVVSRARVTLEDLGSKNGTAIGVAAISGVAELFDGDRIRVGSVGLIFRSAGLCDSTPTSPDKARG